MLNLGSGVSNNSSAPCPSKESTTVSVRFTDGRKLEMTVSGQFASETEITCKSPDFSKVPNGYEAPCMLLT